MLLTEMQPRPKTPQDCMAMVSRGEEPGVALCHSARSPTPSVQQTTIFGEGLLSHERHKLLKGQQRLFQPFDGQPLDRLMLVPDDHFLQIRTMRQDERSVVPQHTTGNPAERLPGSRYLVKDEIKYRELTESVLACTWDFYEY